MIKPHSNSSVPSLMVTAPTGNQSNGTLTEMKALRPQLRVDALILTIFTAAAVLHATNLIVDIESLIGASTTFSAVAVFISCGMIAFFGTRVVNGYRQLDSLRAKMMMSSRNR